MTAPHFKVGDKVRCVRRSEDSGVDAGDVFTVTDSKVAWISFIDSNGRENGWDANNFELVTPTNSLDRQENETEAEHLQRLVDKSNEGFKAAELIYRDYLDKVQYSYTQKEYSYAPEEYLNLSEISRSEGFHYRVKKSKHTFRVANWDASIEGDKVTIGCQPFNKQDLTSALKTLIEGSCRGWPTGGQTFQFTATRKYFGTSEHNITWDQAEELLKELEK